MLYIVIAYLWMAILLYLLLGGADFGAGILELFTSGKNRSVTRKTMYKAIGPIWEANHMWLIIAIVILFVGFPIIYTTVSVYLHIPLLIMLMGIIARGTAFTFRNYDAVQDDMQLIYSRIFVYASVITPLFLGIIAGSIVAGRINPGAMSFPNAYIFSWLGWFPLAVGVFTVSICAFLASVYLIGEADNEADRLRFVIKARTTNITSVAAAIGVYIAATADGVPLIEWLFGNSVSRTAIIAAGLSLFLLWYFIRRRKNRVIRAIAGFQVTMLFTAVSYRHFPNIILLKNGAALSLTEGARNNTIYALGWALLIGSVFILPSLFYLIYSFDDKKKRLI